MGFLVLSRKPGQSVKVGDYTLHYDRQDLLGRKHLRIVHKGGMVRAGVFTKGQPISLIPDVEIMLIGENNLSNARIGFSADKSMRIVRTELLR